MVKIITYVLCKHYYEVSAYDGCTYTDSKLKAKYVIKSLPDAEVRENLSKKYKIGSNLMSIIAYEREGDWIWNKRLIHLRDEVKEQLNV
jgi:hypothetical protein